MKDHQIQHNSLMRLKELEDEPEEDYPNQELDEAE